MLDILRKLNFLITKKQRKGLVILTLFLFIGMILEVFGLGILIPAISLLIEPETIEKTPILYLIRSNFSDFSDQNFLFFFLFIIIILYVIKTFFLVFLTFKQNNYLSILTAHLSNRLFESYLKQHYSFHLKRNASELIKNIHVEINFLYVFLLSLLTIILESGIIIAVTLTLLFIEPIGAISMGLFFGLLSLFFFLFTKKKITSWGQHREKLDTQVSKMAFEGLGGIKDLLILNRAEFFIKKYTNDNYKRWKITAKNSTASVMPRFFLELVTIFGLVGFIVIMIIQDKETATLITTLGVFVVAAFRMIPSLNRIIASVQNLKFYYPSVETIYKEIKSLKVEKHKEIEFNERIIFNSKIEFKNIYFKYESGDTILDEVNLTIFKGQTVGLIGESGSGKSTLIDLLIGLHKPTEGLITVDENDTCKNIKSWMKIIGYVSQTIYLTDDSIKNNIALGISSEEINTDKIKEVINQVQLDKFTNTLKEGLNTKVGERGVQLSGGQRQRIGIARALYHNPEVLVLDEATSALDIKTEIEVMKSIKKLKGHKTIIIIAHRKSTLNDCDSIYEIKNGKTTKVKLSNI